MKKSNISSIFAAKLEERTAAIAAAPVVAKKIENTISRIQDFYGLKNTRLSSLFDLVNPFRRTRVDQTADCVWIEVTPSVNGSHLGSVIFGGLGQEHLHYLSDFRKNGWLTVSGANKVASVIDTQMFRGNRPGRKNAEFLNMRRELISLSLQHPESTIETIVTSFIAAPTLKAEKR